MRRETIVIANWMTALAKHDIRSALTTIAPNFHKLLNNYMN